MTKRLAIITVFLMALNLPLVAQYNHHQKSYHLNIETKIGERTPSKWLKATKVPLILTAAGLYTGFKNNIFDKYEVREERNEILPSFRCHADDYLQYAPLVAVYGLNMVGIKGKNNFGNRTALMVKSELVMAVLTYSLKEVTHVKRPDSGAANSFPSGHTAQAFAAATFMAKEYGEQSIWYSVAAYSTATSVGVMRVLNNRHWVSDVLVGAAVGIFSTNLVYLTHQYKWGSKKRNTVIMPSYSGAGPSLYFRHTF